MSNNVVCILFCSVTSLLFVKYLTQVPIDYFNITTTFYIYIKTDLHLPVLHLVSKSFVWIVFVITS